MSRKNDLVENNSGSGFSFDDDNDFNSMFSEAAGESEDVENDGFEPQTESPLTEKILVDEKQPVINEKETFVAVAEDKPKEVESFNVFEEQNEKPNDSIVSESAVTSPQQKSSFNMKTEASEIEAVARYLRVSDVIRSLSQENLEFVTQCIMLDNVSSNEPVTEEKLIVRAIHSDPMLGKTMNTFIETNSMTDVEKAFHLMDLPSKELQSLASLVGVLSNDPDIDKGATKEISKKLTYAIGKIDTRVLQYIEATRKVLEASK